MSDVDHPTVNKWERLFPVIAQTRDYGGQGRPPADDERHSVSWSAEHLMLPKAELPARERTLRKTIQVWRLMAEQGLLPHPGMIPNGCRRLQDMPGWEDKEYPKSDLFLTMLMEQPPGDVVLPLRHETHQCDRRPVPPEDRPVVHQLVNPRLLMLTSIMRSLLMHDEWTEFDSAYWRTNLEPLLAQLIDHTPEAVA